MGSGGSLRPLDRRVALLLAMEIPSESSTLQLN